MLHCPNMLFVTNMPSPVFHTIPLPPCSGRPLDPKQKEEVFGSKTTGPSPKFKSRTIYRPISTSNNSRWLDLSIFAKAPVHFPQTSPHQVHTTTSYPGTPAKNICAMIEQTPVPSVPLNCRPYRAQQSCGMECHPYPTRFCFSFCKVASGNSSCSLVL